MQTGAYKSNITASGNVCPRQTDLIGIFVSSVTGSPTIVVYDSATTTTDDLVITAFIPTAPVFYPIPVSLKNGINLVITGTLNCTVIFS